MKSSFAKPGEQRWRVLIVDDSPDDVAEARRLLLQGSPRRYDFIEATSGAAALRAIINAPGGPPDCVILDYYLPDFDAPEVLAALAGWDAEGVCPVVVITGKDGQDTGRAALRAGAQDFVGKAWMTAESLTRAVENATERWAMAREIRASQAQLRLALEASKTGIWTWDLTTEAVTWTPECYEIHGLLPGEFDETATGFFHLVHPDDRARVEASVRAAIEAHSRYHLEFRIARPGGEVVWVQNLGRASYDAAGKPLRMLGTLTDINERKRAEEALKARKRELKTLADNTPDILARFDREHRHVFVNAAVERVTGHPIGEFLGKTNRELGMPEERCAQWDTALRAVFHTGQPRTIEFDFLASDGVRHFDSRLVPEVGPSGEVEFILSVAHDVTDRKKAEDALRVSEERLSRAQRAARVGTWDWNIATGEVSWTEEAWRLFGHSPASGSVPHELWLKSVHPDDRDQVARAVDAALQTGTYRQEFRVPPAGGAVRWVESIGETVLDAGGAPVRMLGTIRDVTERHEAEVALRAALSQAQEAVRARDDLVSLVSHDLKNPLNVVVMGIAILEEEIAPVSRPVLKRMARQAQRMNQMIHELLDAAQLHAGLPLSLELQDTDLVDLTRALAEEHQQSAPAHHIEVRATRESIIGTWDPKRIDRVVNNLLSNAVKYSPGGGRVRVDLEDTQDGNSTWALLRVADEGIGIPPADQDLVFGWFSRGENARRMTIEGTGIGLAGVRDIVEQHGGSISVESVEGKGSIFTVKLPTAPPMS